MLLTEYSVRNPAELNIFSMIESSEEKFAPQWQNPVRNHLSSSSESGVKNPLP